MLTLFALLSCGCTGGAEWQFVRARSGYDRPSRIALRVVKAVEGDGLDDMVTKLKEELYEHLLEDHDIVMHFAPDDLPPPFARVTIVSWDEGNRAARLFAPGTGQAELTATLEVFLPESGRAFQGQLQAYLMGGTYGGSAEDVAGWTAEAIASAIATGRAEVAD